MKCNKCNIGEMILKPGKNGIFMACDQYPNCRNTENAPEGATLPVAVAKATETANRDFHLSEEGVRFRALECAIKSSNPGQLQESKMVLDLALVYEIYILGVQKNE